MQQRAISPLQPSARPRDSDGLIIADKLAHHETPPLVNFLYASWTAVCLCTFLASWTFPSHTTKRIPSASPWQTMMGNRTMTLDHRSRVTRPRRQ